MWLRVSIVCVYVLWLMCLLAMTGCVSICCIFINLDKVWYLSSWKIGIAPCVKMFDGHLQFVDICCLTAAANQHSSRLMYWSAFLFRTKSVCHFCIVWPNSWISGIQDDSFAIWKYWRLACLIYLQILHCRHIRLFVIVSQRMETKSSTVSIRDHENQQRKPNWPHPDDLQE